MGCISQALSACTLFSDLYIFFLCFLVIKKHSQNICITPGLNPSSFQRNGTFVSKEDRSFVHSLLYNNGPLTAAELEQCSVHSDLHMFGGFLFLKSSLSNFIMLCNARFSDFTILYKLLVFSKINLTQVSNRKV